MDFIEQLPNSLRLTAILVIIDCLINQNIFIPTVNIINTPELARLFVLYVFLKHDVLFHVTSDYDLEFMSHFFCSLEKALNITLYFISEYHLKGDRQIEHLNQMLEQYLCAYCNYQQNNSSKLLPLVEFIYNNASNVTTGISSFYANKGYHPNITVHPE